MVWVRARSRSGKGPFQRLLWSLQSPFCLWSKPWRRRNHGYIKALVNFLCESLTSSPPPSSLTLGKMGCLLAAYSFSSENVSKDFSFPTGLALPPYFPIYVNWFFQSFPSWDGVATFGPMTFQVSTKLGLLFPSASLENQCGRRWRCHYAAPPQEL